MSDSIRTVCSRAADGCVSPSLVNLFDRVLQHSDKMNRVSDHLHSQSLYFLPSKNQVGRGGRSCHTSTIVTPTGKENAQRMAREQLTDVILRLLAAWRAPLQQLHPLSSNQSLLVSDVSALVGGLSEGVTRLAQKMQTLGLLSSLVPPGGLLERRPPNHLHIFYCFRRDANKVQNYLKVLKCSVVPQDGC